MSVTDPDTYAALIRFDVEAHDTTKPRALLTDDGHLGMSGLRCREQARRILLRLPASDSAPKWAAILGTAIDKQFEDALRVAHPDWLFKETVRATLPSGFEIEGTFDWADPAEPSTTDLKTKDGLALARKHWEIERAYRFQRHLLYLGMIQQHGFPSEGLVRNVVVDRSGKDEHPFVWQEPFSLDVVREADEWLGDVMYAIHNQEEASKDLEGHLCDSCPWLTACRGSAIVTGPITNPHLAERVDLFGMARKKRKEYAALEEALYADVVGITGYTQLFKVTTTKVASNGSSRVLVSDR